jgi:hypothetical protein
MNPGADELFRADRSAERTAFNNKAVNALNPQFGFGVP